MACNNQPPTDENGCDPVTAPCEEGLVCDPFAEGEFRCFEPVVIAGMVIDIATEAPIEGALVQAVDINGAAVGTSGQTDADGRYEITVPVLRDEEGNPLEGVFTLRSQAAAYQEFPTALRPALPIDAATAVQVEGDEEDEGESASWRIENTLTTIGLLALVGDVSQLGSIAGTIEAERNAGLLVVAEGAGGVFVGFSDSAGVFTIFNVPAGSYSVQGYGAGVQLDSTTAEVQATTPTEGVQLTESERPLSTLSGNVQIVNAPGGSVTSVVLAVESTFIETAGRGQVPPGLRAGNVTGAFTIEGIPDGRYVVLAAFENDDLVRDPDENISGTQIIHIQVPDPVAGNVIAISDGFKITEALGIVRPGANGPEEVNGPVLNFEWQDDSSEDGYELRILDAFGNELSRAELPGVSGGATVGYAFLGPALEPGTFYQFRVTSFRERNGERSAISATEDLEGVFFVAAP
jgi:hypothetical protein